MFKTEKDFNRQKELHINQLGYSVISSNENDNNCILAKVEDNHVHIVEINITDEYPLCIILNKEGFDKIIKMIE